MAESPSTPVSLLDTDAICTLLRAHVHSKTPQQTLEYVAELLLDAADDSDDADVATLGGVLEETLRDADALALSSDSAQLLAQQLARLFRPSESNGIDAKAQRRAAHVAALREQYVIGKHCLAVLTEDSEWHPAVIAQHIEHDDDSMSSASTTSLAQRKFRKRSHKSPFKLEIEYIEFGKRVVVHLADVVLDEDRADNDDADNDTSGLCAMCERPMNLTAHHLIPRVTHQRYLKKGYTRAFLNTCVLICRQCHSKIHSVEDERTLARDYNTLEKIMAHPEIVRWVTYARKQKARIRPVKKSKYPVGK